VFTRCRAELIAKVPFARPGVQRHAALASVVAYGLAPYGPDPSVQLRDILQARSLNCGNYTILTFHLVRRAWEEREALRLRQSGWDHGAVGNHPQVHVGDLLLDPTTAVIARIRYRELVRGEPAAELVEFARRPDIEAFGIQVVDALEDGLWRSSDVLYKRDYSGWRTFS
jgi:hypothetical protein